jgi:hypothetical protein
MGPAMSSPSYDANAPVEAQYKYTAEEVSKGLRMHMRYNFAFLRFVRIVGWMMLVAAFGSLFFGKVTVASMIPLGVLALFFLLSDRFIDLQFRLKFRQNPNKDALVSWTFSSDSISSEGEGFNFTLAWNKVFTFIDSSKGFLIYPQKQLFYWIPFSGFKNESEIDYVRQTAKSQAITYKKVS